MRLVYTHGIPPSRAGVDTYDGGERSRQTEISLGDAENNSQVAMIRYCAVDKVANPLSV